MALEVLLKLCALWFGILVVAIVNGMFRQRVLIPAFGAVNALIASGIILSVCIFLFAFLGTAWYGRLMPSQYWLIGLCWVLLTVAFELGFGRFVQHKTWAELLEAYTFKAGNLWPVVLLITFISPALAARLRASFSSHRSLTRQFVGR